MKRLLLRSEKEVVRSKTTDSTICQVLYPTCKNTEKSLKTFHLSAEQMMMEIISVIDTIRERDPKDAKLYILTLWNEIYCDCRDLSPDNTPEQELKLATATILHGVVLILAHCTTYVSYYQNLIVAILSQCSDPIDGCFCPEINKQYNATTFRFQEQKLCEEITNYINSDDFISEDIQNVIATIEEQEEVPISSNSRKFTINQLIILFDIILDTSFENGLSNVSAISRLLSKISGYGEDSIRPRIEKFSYDKAQTKLDAQQLIPYLQEIKPTLAKQLENNIK